MADSNLMQMLQGSMRYQTQRQTVLAQNISNLDTPNYQAQDLKKANFADMAHREGLQLSMSTTSGSHLPGTLGGADDFKKQKLQKAFEITPVGNNVVLEEQMAKVSDTGAQYEISSTLFKKFTSLYHTALDKGNS